MLSDGQSVWKKYLEILAKANMDFNAMLEFVVEDEPENFLADTKTLKQWISNGL